jgi:hypothetical protein
MPRPYSVTVIGSTTATAGLSVPWQPNHMTTPFAIGIGVVTSSCLSLGYSVQHTFDNIFDDAIPGQATVLSCNATWFNHTTLTAIASKADSNYAFPVIGIRLACTTSSSGSRSATMTLIQAGP